MARRPPDCSSNLCLPKTFAVWLFRGCLGPPSCCFFYIRGPNHPLKKSYSKCFRQTQIRWVIWWSSNGPKMWRKLPDFRAERKAQNPVTSLAVMVFRSRVSAMKILMKMLCVTSSGLVLAKHSREKPLQRMNQMRFLALNRADAPCFCTKQRGSSNAHYTTLNYTVKYGKFTVFRTQNG